MNDWIKTLIPILLLAIGTLAWYMFTEIEHIKETTTPEKYLELKFEGHANILNDHEERLRKVEHK